MKNILKEHFKSNRGKVVDFLTLYLEYMEVMNFLIFLKDKVNRAWTFFENGSIEDKFSYAQVFRNLILKKLF